MTWTGNGVGDTQGVFARRFTATSPPIVTVPGLQTTSEDTNLVFSSGNGNLISIADPDAGSNPIEVTVSVTQGDLTLSGTTNLTFSSGDGINDTSMTFRGTVAAINTALTGLSYRPASNTSGSATLTIQTLDNTLVSLNFDTNLQGRYTFEGNANDVAPGTVQSGTLLNGASFVTDSTRGQVLNLDGIDDNVQISSTC